MTAQQDREVVPFSKFIGALDPWLEQVALIGGWAHRLYRLDSLRLWRRGGIEAAVAAREATVGERWYVSCFQCGRTIR